MNKRMWIGLMVGILGGIIDQVTKWWVITKDGNWILNTGVAWGWGNGVGNNYLIVLISGLIIFLLWQIVTKWKEMGNVHLLSWWLLLAGSMSNLIDRVYWGGVVDWITVFEWFPWFNIADSMISVGVIGLLLSDYLDGE